VEHREPVRAAVAGGSRFGGDQRVSAGRPKSRGTARSRGAVEHGLANGGRQRRDQIPQREGRIAAVDEELAALSPERVATRRATLGLKKEEAAEQLAAERAIQGLGLGFNFLLDGTEVSDADDKRLVREAEKVQTYWKQRTGERAGEWKSAPLGGYIDDNGESAECPVWYFCSNMTPWHTWAIIDGTRDGLNGKEFLKVVMTRHTVWLAEYTMHRLVCGQCHQKPNNIHNQSWWSVIGEAIGNPSKPKELPSRSRPTGHLLGRPDMKGRGKSPMKFTFLCKTGCSLANLRREGFDINKLTGDPEMSDKLDRWILKRRSNGHEPLDMVSEFKLSDIVEAACIEFPKWAPYFSAAKERHKEKKIEELRRIHEEVTREKARADLHDLQARLEAAERTSAEVREGAQMIQENAKVLSEKNGALAGELAKAKAEASVQKYAPPTESRVDKSEIETVKVLTKEAMKSQYRLIREFESLATSLEISNQQSTKLTLKPEWKPYYAKTVRGKLVVTEAFFKGLSGLHDFPEEAEDLRAHALRYLSPAEPSPAPDHATKSPAKPDPKYDNHER
jgi:hypothetical protein